jgi:hypothetical protein
MSKKKPLRFVLDTAKLVLAGASRRHKLKVWMNQLTISSNPHDLQSITAQLRILQADLRDNPKHSRETISRNQTTEPNQQQPINQP